VKQSGIEAGRQLYEDWLAPEDSKFTGGR